MIALLRALVVLHLLGAAWAAVAACVAPIPGPWWAWLVVSVVAVIIGAACSNVADDLEAKNPRRFDFR